MSSVQSRSPFVSLKRAAVVGAGAWGTPLADHTEAMCAVRQNAEAAFTWRRRDSEAAAAA